MTIKLKNLWTFSLSKFAGIIMTCTTVGVKKTVTFSFRSVPLERIRNARFRGKKRSVPFPETVIEQWAAPHVQLFINFPRISQLPHFPDQKQAHHHCHLHCHLLTIDLTLFPRPPSHHIILHPLWPTLPVHHVILPPLCPSHLMHQITLHPVIY